MLADEQ